MVISGGPQKDNLSIAGFPQTTEVSLLGGLDQDRLAGGRFNDILVDGDSQDANGSPGTEQLEGGAGVDVLIGNRGADRLRGGPGGDLLMSTSSAMETSSTAAPAEITLSGRSCLVRLTIPSRPRTGSFGTSGGHRAPAGVNDGSWPVRARSPRSSQ